MEYFLARGPKALILIGITLAVIGFSGHLIVPNMARSYLVINVGANDTAVEHLEFRLGPAAYNLHLDVITLSSNFHNSSVYVMDDSEYHAYLQGTPVDDLHLLLELDGTSRASLDSNLGSDVSIYLVFINFHDQDSMWAFYVSILPNTFYSTALLGFSGVSLILVALGWYFQGWRRYFILGTCVNLALFIMRIFTLPTYSLGLPPVFDDIITTELYNDYQFFYTDWVGDLLAGAPAYSDELWVYLYPPLFIYTISALGFSAPWLPAVPIFALNIGTGALVYLITLNLSGDEKQSIAAMMLYFFNPFTLFYGSFMWLNPVPHVFFVTLAFYFALIDRTNLSLVTLGIATLYKQFTVIFFPLLVITLIKRRTDLRGKHVITDFALYTVLYAAPVLLVSLPFLLTAPDLYLFRMISGNTGMTVEFLNTFHSELSYPINFNTFFLWIGGPTLFTYSIAVLLSYYVILGLSGILVYGALARFRPSAAESSARIKELMTQVIFWAAIGVILIQLFYPRGAYKFYLLALTPFISILFDFNDLSFSGRNQFQFNPRHLGGVILSVAVFLCYRYVYFLLLLGWMIYFLWKEDFFRRGLKTVMQMKPASVHKDIENLYSGGEWDWEDKQIVD
ncbi:MAG: hypothetical protein ACFE7R_01610 [Candidatus Hodarchaeota archaeon]